MEIPAVIDVAIGLVVLYLLLSTLGSFVVELIATWLWWRKRLLYETIGRLITGAAHCPAPTVPQLPTFSQVTRKIREKLPKRFRPPPAFSPELLTAVEIADAREIGKQIRKPNNAICQVLAEKIGPKLYPKVRASPPDGSSGGQPEPDPVPSVRALVKQLNSVIETETLYENDRFKTVELSPDTQTLLVEVLSETGPKDPRRVRRLNRLLIEDANPDAIRRERRLTDEMLVEFWEHPLVKNLSPEQQWPSYVEPATFASIVIDVAVPGAAEGTLPATAEGIERVIELGARSGHAHLKSLRERLLTIHRLRDVHHGAGPADSSPLATLRAGIERWYGEAMDRLNGQYKRKVQKALFWTGMVLAALLNADTIRTAHVLTTDDALRAATAAYAATLATPKAATTNEADKGVAPNSNQTNEVPVATLRAELATSMRELQKLQRLGFPLGWKDLPWSTNSLARTTDFAPNGGSHPFAQIFFKLIGLLATAFAVSLGAPFWFDLLGKLVSLRSAGKRAGASGKIASPADAATGAKQEGGDGAKGQKSDSTAPTTPPPPQPAECPGDLADVGSGFNPRKAYWCAEAAQLAYSAKESVRAAVGQWSMDDPWFFDQVEAAQGFLAVARDKRVAVLAFRGTEKKLEDWKTDAKFKLVPSPAGSGNAHEGFTNELAAVYAEVAGELRQRLGPQTLLYVTGHSLGGGLATLMAARLTADKARGVHAVHTFGSPRVGDAEFAKAYQLALGPCTYRIVNGEDLVTRVPPRVIPGTEWRYDHVGQIVYFDSDGRMQMNAGFWDRFLNTVINAVADFRATAKAALKDHSMEGYVRLLKKSAGENS